MDYDYDENDLYRVEMIFIEETKEILEWRKHAFQCKQKSTYWIENQNYMTCIHDKELNKIVECNLLHDIINPPKHTKLWIAIAILLQMNVCILGNLDRSLRTFKFYLKVDIFHDFKGKANLKTTSWKVCCDAMAHSGRKHHY